MICLDEMPNVEMQQVKKQKEGKHPERILGEFTLSDGQTAVGNLTLDGPRTLLRLHSDKFLNSVAEGQCLPGMTFDARNITLIDCRSPGTGQTGFTKGETRYHAEVFPHYVAIGRQHLDPDKACVTAIHFTTTDLQSLFYDFDAFGSVIDSNPIIDTVLAEARQTRPIEAGEHPRVFYFTGKHRIVSVNTVLGRISVNHRTRSGFGGPSGVFIQSKMYVSLEIEPPVALDVALERMRDIRCFLSLAAGRSQGVGRIDITTDEVVDGVPSMLRIYQSHRQKANKSEHLKAHVGDVPLDPIRNQSEFSAVLIDWMERHSTWRLARGRYLGCLQKGNKYDVDRLVAAANMFDILPKSAFPGVAGLDTALSEARDQCYRLLRALTNSPDRNSALSALGRLGQLSLPKKVAHRAAIVEAKLGERFPDLQLVVGVAIKCRNYFVHGSSADINFERVEPFVIFMTETLEFVFAASDLIEAGWDAAQWDEGEKGWGHSFARIRSYYGLQIEAFRRAASESSAH